LAAPDTPSNSFSSIWGNLIFYNLHNSFKFNRLQYYWLTWAPYLTIILRYWYLVPISKTISYDRY